MARLKGFSDCSLTKWREAWIEIAEDCLLELGLWSALWMAQFYNFTDLATFCLGPPDNFRLEAKHTFPKKVIRYCCQENDMDVSMKSLGTELCIFTLQSLWISPTSKYPKNSK